MALIANIYFPQLWSLELQDQCAKSFSVGWEPTSLFTDGHFLAVSCMVIELSEVSFIWKMEYMSHFQKYFQIYSVVFYRLLFLVYIFKLLFYFLKYIKHTWFLHLLIPIHQVFMCLTQHFVSICSYLWRLAFLCVLCFLIVSFCSWNSYLPPLGPRLKILLQRGIVFASASCLEDSKLELINI